MINEWQSRVRDANSDSSYEADMDTDSDTDSNMTNVIAKPPDPPTEASRPQGKHHKQAADSHANPPTPRRYPVTVRDKGGVEHRYEIQGDALEASQCWTKADVSTVLHDENPELFRSYVGLVCYGKEVWQQDIDASIAQSNLHPTDGSPMPPAIVCAREKVFDDLIRVYILTDKFMDPGSANIVIDQMIRFSKETCLLPHPEAINQAYNSTLEGSPLRALLRD
jgi:hypothetical protein